MVPDQAGYAGVCAGRNQTITPQQHRSTAPAIERAFFRPRSLRAPALGLPSKNIDFPLAFLYRVVDTLITDAAYADVEPRTTNMTPDVSRLYPCRSAQIGEPLHQAGANGGMEPRRMVR